MKKIQIYDPPMCCSTGVCGTDVDPKLVQFASDLAALKEQGASVERFNLAQQPAAFAENEKIRAALAAHGNDCLPLVLIDGEIAMRGVYPTREQLALLAGSRISFSAEGGTAKGESKSAQSGCCCKSDSKSSCC